MGTKRTAEFRQEAVRIALTSGLLLKRAWIRRWTYVTRDTPREAAFDCIKMLYKPGIMNNDHLCMFVEYQARTTLVSSRNLPRVSIKIAAFSRIIS